MVEQKIKNEITSLELLAEINKFRKEEGIKKELLHKTLLDIIRDEFSEEIDRQKILPMSYKDRYCPAHTKINQDVQFLCLF